MLELRRHYEFSCSRGPTPARAPQALAGVNHLTRLPRLKEATFSDCRQITSDVIALFSPGVKVRL